MRVRVNLHAHEQQASGDSTTPIGQMALAYRDAGYDLAGFVGHDDRPINDGTIMPTVTGIEHELRTDPTRLHVVEYPDFDFTILAHPRLTWPEDTREQAREAIDRLGVDAVEKYSRGRQQYQGSLPVPELGNDDAHNTYQVGLSYTMVDVDEASIPGVFDAIRAGRVEAVNDPNTTGYAIGRVHQGLSMLRWKMGR